MEDKQQNFHYVSKRVWPYNKIQVEKEHNRVKQAAINEPMW